MYNYLIIPTYPGYELLIYSNLAQKKYRVAKRIEAVRILELLNLSIRLIDKPYSVNIPLNVFPVNSLDDVEKFDTETTINLNLDDLEVA